MKAYQHMWRLLRYRPLLYTINGLLWTLIHVAPIIPGLLAQQFFDRLYQIGHLNNELWLLIILFVATALARVIIILFGGITDNLHRFSMSGILRRNLLTRILERPGAHAVPGSSGEAISRFRDDAEQAEDAISWTLDSIGTGLFALIAIIVLLHVDALVTLLVFVPLVCVVAITQMLHKRLEKYRVASRKATGGVTSAIGEIFNTIQGIKVAAAEPYVVAHFHHLNEARRTTMIKDRLLEQLINSTFGNTASIGTGLILLVAAQAIHKGQLSIGDLALFIYYLAFVADFTQFFGMFLAHYAQTKVAFQRMETLLQGAPPPRLTTHHPLYLNGKLPALPLPSTQQESLTSLQVKNLSYHYPDTGRGIDDISFDMRAGSLTVITGRIASCKTTLLQVLLGLLPRDTGTISWNGQPIEDPASFFVPPHSAYTPQIPHLFSTTLKENLLLDQPEDSTRLASAIHTAVMEQDLATLENGLETVIGTRGVKLSGGQAQRTAAARMFLRDPALLVFDDLSSALDVETEQLLWQRIFTGERRSYLVVSHRRSVLQKADHIILLQNGRLIAQGTLTELLQTSSEMQYLWSGNS